MFFHQPKSITPILDTFDHIFSYTKIRKRIGIRKLSAVPDVLAAFFQPAIAK